VKPAEPAPKPAVSTPAPAPAKGDYWVQVGAFSDPKNAARLGAKLTAEKYSVERATVKRGGGGDGRNEIFAPGVPQRDLYDKVKDKGLRADAVKGGSVVRPLLPLRDAVALSKELAAAGMAVKIRRVGAEKGTVYLVRVGGFADRKEADAAKAELEGKGIPGFVVKGPPR
jgi:cell division septation protein DedD